MKNAFVFPLILFLGMAACRRGITENNDWGAAPYLSTDQTDIRVGYGSFDTTIMVNSNLWWNVEISYPESGEKDWITAFGPVSSNATRGLTLEYGPNVMSEDRSAFITLTSDIDGAAEPYTFTITQSLWPQGKLLDSPEITIENAQILQLVWPKVVGANNYVITVTDEAGDELWVDNFRMKTDTVTYDLGVGFAEHYYNGIFRVRVKAETVRPELFSQSGSVSDHSLFATGTGSGSGQGDEIWISCPRHLANIYAPPADEAYLAKHYKQVGLIDFTGVASHRPIGSGTSDETCFSGSYDGTDNIVANMNFTLGGSITEPNPAWGLFGVTASGASIGNIVFESCTLTITGRMTTNYPQGTAFCVGSNIGGHVSHITVKDCRIEVPDISNAGNIILGGVVGHNPGGEGVISDCRTEGGGINVALHNGSTTTVGSGTVGGIVGNCPAGGRIVDCVNGMPIDGRAQIAGGISGNNGTLIRCGNSAAISGALYFGGLIGRMNESVASNDTIRWCWNTGDVILKASNSEAYIGGLIGNMNASRDALIIAECFNTGTVSDQSSQLRWHKLGGIVGRSVHVSPTTVIRDCYNAGEVLNPCKTNGTGPEQFARTGGIIGSLLDTGNPNTVSGTQIYACYSVGRVSRDEQEFLNNVYAGIAGGRHTDSAAPVKYCYYLTGSSDSGVAIGFYGDAPTIGVEDVPGGGKSPQQLTDINTYTPGTVIYGGGIPDSGFDFATVWSSPSGNYPYPQLLNNPHRDRSATE